jgi:hypothetical protein
MMVRSSDAWPESEPARHRGFAGAFRGPCRKTEHVKEKLDQ